ncbi:hypothetical protein [Pseudomonas fontis]|uniref:Prophage PSSB64-02 n=1 Tax=Pseudomonas fontis TaxID=2942633 RepID=A0ABT5NXL4_9PSED|nr:hypothetical protein [Pseudomonas fontis]MDD0973787.1 hypothetical protein [Pseudomonas fontis]MDD0992921.1 hypothetical protein [Pseudomonas fontis]
MAMSQQQRDEKRRLKAAKVQEEDLRLKVRPGTKRALLELMAWAGIEEQGEAMTLMIHHMHGLGPSGALPLLEPPRHKYKVSQSVALEFSRKSMLMIQHDPGDEVISPVTNPAPH